MAKHTLPGQISIDFSTPLCQCGCGLPAPVSLRRHLGRGMEKGDHWRYIFNHYRSKGHPARPVAERLWERVDKNAPNGCWLWTGNLDGGYGKIHVAHGTCERAHRLAWRLLNGPIPPGMLVCHNCPGGDNPACVNPAHLWLGTYEDNNRDRAAKGRGAVGERAGSAKLTEQSVREIRELVPAGLPQAEAAKRYGISEGYVSSIIHRRKWQHIP